MILVTGAAGFIGSSVAQRLLDLGEDVLGVDNLNDYYDPQLKQARLARLQHLPRFQFQKVDISDTGAMQGLFDAHRPERVVHLAAQAGVRYSLTHPHAYVDANIRGFLNILEGCRQHPVAHLVYASTSSVYGANTRQPFSEHDSVNHPLTLYAATKKANELMAHSYAHLFGIPATGLRFFTVYGPWGRPDMAPLKFTRGILAGEPIPVYNRGQMVRDFTYIDDITEGVVRVLAHPAAANPAWSGDAPDPATSSVPYRIYNIGNNQPVLLLDFISAIERAVGKKAVIDLQPMQPGDVLSTRADVGELEMTTGFRPAMTVDEGVRRLVVWYRDYYGV